MKSDERPCYRVRRLKIGRTPQMDQLAHAAGQLYSQVVVWFWRTVRHHDVWLHAKSLMRWLTSALLHAHSGDAVVQSFFAALASWRERRKEDPDAKPPHRRKWYYRVQWKATAITLKDGVLRLSNGQHNAPLVIPWVHEMPVLVEMGWDGRQYELRAVYRVEPAEPVTTGLVAGIDLGEVHLAASHDGERTTIANGGHVRALRRFQNKLKGKLSALIDRCRKGSRRKRRRVRSKKKQLRRLVHQLRDALHKQTTNLVSTLHEIGVQTLAMGDLRNIRQRKKYTGSGPVVGTLGSPHAGGTTEAALPQARSSPRQERERRKPGIPGTSALGGCQLRTCRKNKDVGHVGNQRIHQMPSGQVRFMLTYKARARGMQVVLVPEHYTSQTCPRCGKRYKPKGREYRCARCGFTFHRDGVGAINIRQKYTASGPVVGVMASPIGVRHHAHLRCSSLSDNDREKESHRL